MLMYIVTVHMLMYTERLWRMEDTLSLLIKEANKPKHASVRKSCQEALGKLHMWNYRTLSFV